MRVSSSDDQFERTKSKRLFETRREWNVRFWQRLMNCTPSLKNSRGTSRISSTWSAIVIVVVEVMQKKDACLEKVERNNWQRARGCLWRKKRKKEHDGVANGFTRAGRLAGGTPQ